MNYPAIKSHATLKQAVDARELHKDLGSKSDYSTWVKKQIERLELIEHADYEVLHFGMEQVHGGHNRIDYALSVEASKMIAGRSDTSIGNKVLRYLIECEKKAMQIMPAIDLDDPLALTMLTEALSVKVNQQRAALSVVRAENSDLKSTNADLEIQVEQITPKAAALDRIADMTGNICITDSAKVIQIKPKELFEWLSTNKWIYRRLGSGWIGFQNRINQGLLEHKVVTVYSGGQKKIREQVLITPKGLAYLAEAFEVAG